MGAVMLQATGSDVDKSVLGSCLHGPFASVDLRHALLGRIGVTASGRDYHADVDARHGDVGGLLALAGRGKGSA